ncbi:DnaB-like helicase C-terminal domain-containing protein [Streptomyces avidinii]|uniref:DnaB-like helicase C-terminal domain-containing protein n=1 Tax=Streptomyces avidinii TaxID=1895 RepID=UPI0037A19E07
MPVFAVSTLNRSPEQRTDKKPFLSDLRDSGALEHNADLVILIHPPTATLTVASPRRRRPPRGTARIGAHRKGKCTVHDR